MEGVTHSTRSPNSISVGEKIAVRRGLCARATVNSLAKLGIPLETRKFDGELKGEW